jgi:protein-arginine kinase activator protein McsA
VLGPYHKPLTIGSRLWAFEISNREILQREMESAVSKEMYERAAELRDAIKQLGTQAH